MVFCPAGIISVLICIWIVLRGKEVFFNMVLFTAILEIFVGKGFIYGQTDLVQLPFVITLIYSMHLKKISPSLSKKWLLMIGSFCFSILYLLLFPSNAMVAAPPDVTWDAIVVGKSFPVHPQITKEVIIMTIKFICFSIVYVYIYTNWEYKKYRIFLNKLSHISNYFLILTCLEFVVKNIMQLNNLWGDLDLAFWGDTASTVHAGRLRGIFYESTLFQKEASTHAFSLFVVSLIKFANNVANGKSRKIDYTIILCYILMYLSTSFTSVILTLTFIIIYFVYRWGILRPETMRAEQIIISFIGIGLFMFSSILFVFNSNEDSFILNRFFSFIDNVGNYFTFEDYRNLNTTDDGSTFVRTLSIMQTLKTFLERPLFGYSLFALWCHGASVTFLASVGIIGVVFWFRFYYLGIPLKKMITPNHSCYLIGFCVIFLCLFFSGGLGALKVYSNFLPLVFIVCNCYIFSKNDNVNYNLLQCSK